MQKVRKARPDPETRLKLRVRGIVQGVGFRPFIYAQAKEHHLTGFVLNDGEGVLLEVEGEREEVRSFLAELPLKAPPQSAIREIREEWLPPAGHAGFDIRQSAAGESRTALVSPDLGLCEDCLRELEDPSDRRFRYPFINCTNCGPRFTILREIPYDRAKTTMSEFPLCPECCAEYEDPSSRRFHAQPNACFACGPSLSLLDQKGGFLTGSGLLDGPGRDKKSVADLRRESDDCLTGAARLLADGRILALKGLGGFHLACDAENPEAVTTLRARKVREGKPFALMVPDLEAARRIAEIAPEEENLLLSVRRPIVLLRKKEPSPVAEEVAPAQKYLGLMLPYTPLQHLRLRASGRILVMTSGNLCDEPISFENREALAHLPAIADAFLLHNRKIHVRCDDSVTRLFSGVELPVRRSRGYVPFPIELSCEFKKPVLACGGELKNTFCLGRGRQAFPGNHIGDLENVESLAFFESSVEHFKRLFAFEPAIVAHDLHPDYLSTKYALSLPGAEKAAVQHHHAHIASVMAENGLDGRHKVIGVAFDGTGYGEDGTLWGGEFLLADFSGYERMGHLQALPLPGGEKAVREPWRMAASFLFRAFGDSLFSLPLPFIQRLQDRLEGEWPIFRKMIADGLQSPLTSGAGRLFDAVSALIGLREEVLYEGQAAVELEMAASEGPEEPYSFDLEGRFPLVVRPEGIFRGIVSDLQEKVPLPLIAARFHETVARLVAEVCSRIRRESGVSTTALSGGVFQNRRLLTLVEPALRKRGFEVLRHRLLPPNDGGLALGQAVVANERCS